MNNGQTMSALFDSQTSGIVCGCKIKKLNPSIWRKT
jgi:hypothetical protein